MIYCIIYRKST